MLRPVVLMKIPDDSPFATLGNQQNPELPKSAVSGRCSSFSVIFSLRESMLKRPSLQGQCTFLLLPSMIIFWVDYGLGIKKAIANQLPLAKQGKSDRSSSYFCDVIFSACCKETAPNRI